jgi:hypothetical protein
MINRGEAMNNNKVVRKDNHSGYPGVCYEVRCNKWRAYIDIGKYKKSLGYFSNKEDAIQARIKAEQDILKRK